jgi:hypothetical protein
MNRQILVWLRHFFPFYLGFWVVWIPAVVRACPLCINASPYKDGLLWAVGFLIVIPFILVYLLYGWIRRAS